MKQIQHRSRCCKGFTLIEMLIVVAIIAILVLVSVPMVSASLEEAREAADAANVRAAKAAALSAYVSEGQEDHITYFYKSDGTVIEENPDFMPMAGDPGYDYGQSEGNRGGYVTVGVYVKDNSIQFEIEWTERKP